MRSAGWCVRTEQACVQWIRRFILFHGKRHPRDMCGPGAHSISQSPRQPAQRGGIHAEPGSERDPLPFDGALEMVVRT
jgi:hypothetical protein